MLERSVWEQIAAGEVVERPASVVKELVENSVDAGATRVTVEISRGGMQFIRVTDNGKGIARDDVRLAFVSHATSKIRTAPDLEGVGTYGFRGEALASAAAVSRAEMLTKTADETFGTRYVIEGGEEKLLDDAGCPDGTTILIRDLFFNAPARLKFMKKDQTEGTYCSDAVGKAAVAAPGVSFRLIRDGKQTLFTSGDGNAYNAVTAVYGKDFAENLIPCEYENNGVKVTGFVCRPDSCRPTRSMQMFFVNGRSVRLPVGASALDEGYRHSVMTGKYPSCVLYLTVPGSSIDVNVHPAKTEIRFSDDRKLFEAVYYAVKSALSGPSAVHVPVPEPVYTPKIPEPKPVQITMPAVAEISRTDPKPDYTVRETPAVRFSDTGASYSSGEPSVAFPETKRVNIDVEADDIKDDTPGANPPVSAQIPEETDFSVPVIIGEIFRTYIVAQYKNELLLVDKHALHERLIYDRLVSAPENTRCQLLLAPVTVRLGRKEYSAVMDNIGLFADAGYEISDFGNGAVRVTGCPAVLAGEDVASLVTELAGKLVSGSRSLKPEKLIWIYENTACRAAIKAGSDLKPEEAVALIREMFGGDVRSCPHGRPVMVSITRSEIEKKFGRIV